MMKSDTRFRKPGGRCLRFDSSASSVGVNYGFGHSPTVVTVSFTGRVNLEDVMLVQRHDLSPEEAVDLGKRLLKFAAEAVK